MSKVKAIGTARLKHFDDFIEWFLDLAVEEAYTLYDKVVEAFPRKDSHSDSVENVIKSNLDQLYHVQGGYGGWRPEDAKEAKWERQKADTLKLFNTFKRLNSDFGQKINVGVWDCGITYIYTGNPLNGLVIPEPEKYLEFIPFKDYSDITPTELKAALGAGDVPLSNLVPTNMEASLTQTKLKDKASEEKTRLEQLEQEMEDVKSAKTAELAELKAEIDAKMAELRGKQEAMMASLNAMKAEMETKLEALQMQIYLLDSQIYSILCYAGETVTFGQIRKGKNAPDNEPIVVHQKLRFLDEDLGRLTSLYEIEWEEIEMFESFLKHHPLALDTFAPNERCVTLVRLSRTASQYGRDYDKEYANVLKKYDYYHGKTIGIIIRNGENMYLGWTDEDRVHITDDLIITQAIDLDPGEMPEFRFESEKEAYVNYPSPKGKGLR